MPVQLRVPLPGPAASRRTPARVASAVVLLIAALAAPAARADKTDREKPINYSADAGDVNYQTKMGTLSGNVIVTQGTLSIHADKIVLKQNPDNSLSATAYGNPVAFRQKRDGIDEFYDGYAQRVEYDGAKEFLQLFDRALLRRGQDEIRSNYISYSIATELFKAEGRPETTPGPSDAGPGSRVRGVFQPKSEAAAGAGTKDAAKAGPREAPKGPTESTPLPRSRERASCPSRGSKSVTSRAPSSTTCRSTWRAAKWSDCWGPMAPARRRAST
jgi:lipopolysaccharide export system protein LptA